LSHFVDVQDWNAAKEFGILGVINRRRKARHDDKTCSIRRTPAASHGLLYGAYHFLWPGDPPAQADHFLEVVIPSMIQRTCCCPGSRGSERAAGNAKQFLARVEHRPAVAPFSTQDFSSSNNWATVVTLSWRSTACGITFQFHPVCPLNWENLDHSVHRRCVGPGPHQVPASSSRAVST